MRPPRYRFPDEVRTATRMMASRMVRDGTVPETPEALEGWIAGAPLDIREPLDRGGYGEAFSADDLFPLLQVFVGQAGGPAAEAEAAPRSSVRPWLVALGVLIVAAILVMIIARVGFTQARGAAPVPVPAVHDASSGPEPPPGGGITRAPAPPAGG